MKIGLVGLGRMGAAMSQRLREHGFDVVGWDMNADRNKAASESGLRIAANPRAVAAEAEMIISIITEDHGVRHIFKDADGFLSGDVKGKLFIEMSTLQPMTGRELAPLVEAAGARLIEVPGARHHSRKSEMESCSRSSADGPRISSGQDLCWKR